MLVRAGLRCKTCFQIKPHLVQPTPGPANLAPGAFTPGSTNGQPSSWGHVLSLLLRLFGCQLMHAAALVPSVSNSKMKGHYRPQHRAADRAQRTPWPSSSNSPAMQWNQGQPTAQASQLSTMSRMNAGLTGPLAFDADTSAAYEPLQHCPSSQDFSGQPTETSLALENVSAHVSALETRLSLLEAERRGAQQALWHHSRRAHEQPRLRSLLTPWSFMSSKVDAVRIRLDQVYSRLAGLLHTLQQAFPAIAMYFY